MKVLILELNNKKYTTVKITAFMSKEALKIQKEALALAKSGQLIKESSNDFDAVDVLLSDLLEIRERKVALICEVYGNKFTADEVEKHLSDEEIDKQVNDIILGICGVVSKNV